MSALKSRALRTVKPRSLDQVMPKTLQSEVHRHYALSEPLRVYNKRNMSALWNVFGDISMLNSSFTL